MLKAAVQKFREATVVRCQGRIVVGDACAILRNAVLSQTDTRMLVLDLAHVDRIDAAGLGVLLGVREWAHSNAVRFKLMNVMNNVEQVLELTKLGCVFEFCSIQDLFHLLDRSAAVTPWAVEQSSPADAAALDCSIEWQEVRPAVKKDNLLVAAS